MNYESTEIIHIIKLRMTHRWIGGGGDESVGARWIRGGRDSVAASRRWGGVDPGRRRLGGAFPPLDVDDLWP